MDTQELELEQRKRLKSKRKSTGKNKKSKRQTKKAMSAKQKKKKTKKIRCPILVMTTKRQLLILKRLLEEDGLHKLLMSVDGTFNLVRGNGVVVNFGIVKRWLRKMEITHPCFNILHVYCQTENKDAIIMASEVMRNIPVTLLRMTRVFEPLSTSLDRSLGISLALKTVWPLSIQTSCYTHVLTNLKKAELQVTDNRDTVVSDIIFLNERAYSDDMMKLLLNVVMEAWRDMGEKKLAASFEKVYGDAPFMRFFVTACRVVGLYPSNNMIERSHKDEKLIIGPRGLLVRTGDFLCRTMPAVTRQCPDIPLNDEVCMYDVI